MERAYLVGFERTHLVEDGSCLNVYCHGSRQMLIKETALQKMRRLKEVPLWSEYKNLLLQEADGDRFLREMRQGLFVFPWRQAEDLDKYYLQLDGVLEDVYVRTHHGDLVQVGDTLRHVLSHTTQGLSIQSAMILVAESLAVDYADVHARVGSELPDLVRSQAAHFRLHSSVDVLQ